MAIFQQNFQPKRESESTSSTDEKCNYQVAAYVREGDDDDDDDSTYDFAPAA